MLPINSIVNGDNLTVMKTFPDNCIDAIVTDPPYALTTTAMCILYAIFALTNEWGLNHG